MGITRPCKRCRRGTETCVVINFWTCDRCDRDEIKHKPLKKKKRPLGTFVCVVNKGPGDSFYHKRNTGQLVTLCGLSVRGDNHKKQLTCPECIRLTGKNGSGDFDDEEATDPGLGHLLSKPTFKFDSEAWEK